MSDLVTELAKRENPSHNFPSMSELVTNRTKNPTRSRFVTNSLIEGKLCDGFSRFASSVTKSLISKKLIFRKP
jgi:hypothetical protein